LRHALEFVAYGDDSRAAGRGADAPEFVLGGGGTREAGDNIGYGMETLGK